jgi:8-oxo-dGTP diphosphatase
MSEAIGQNYVLGFLFRGSQGQVALIEKQRPSWQKGFLNGIGGKIEYNEQPHEAIIREFFEETSACVQSWRQFAVLHWRDGCVFCYVSHGEFNLISITDERVNWFDVSSITMLPIIPKLRWLIPLALDESVISTITDYS